MISSMSAYGARDLNRSAKAEKDSIHFRKAPVQRVSASRDLTVYTTRTVTARYVAGILVRISADPWF